MRRLSGLDGQFLHFETANEKMHHLSLFVLRRDDRAPVSFEEIRAHVERRLDVLEMFRRRILDVPLGLHHPLWIEDGTFDLDLHVHPVVVRPPGRAGEVAEAVTAISGALADRRRPLWELFVLEGLAEGRTGVVLKLHHALCDGAAILEIYRALWTGEDDFDVSTFPSPAPARGTAWGPDPIPPRRRLLTNALVDHGRSLRALPALTRRTVRGVQAAKAHEATIAVVAPPAAPSVFNRRVGPGRSWAVGSVPLADVKAVRAAVPGVTVNDVLLAALGGSLRAYLSVRNSLPDGPMVASVPVGTEATKSNRQGGNHVSYFNAPLGTDIADPLARLHHIHEVAAAAKTRLQLLGPDTLESWVEFAVPALVKGFKRLAEALHLPEKQPPTTSLTFSNVAGPATPYRVLGALVEEMYVSGPPFDGAPVNVTALSYDGRVELAVHADAASVAEPDEVIAGVATALAELRAAVGARSTHTTSPTATTNPNGEPGEAVAAHAG